jgi:hypothetical protein
MFACAEDELFQRHLPGAPSLWRAMGPARLIKLAQHRAERLARFQRDQVLQQDNWLDESLPF